MGRNDVKTVSTLHVVFYDESRRRKMEKGIVRLLDTKDNTKRFRSINQKFSKIPNGPLTIEGLYWVFIKFPKFVKKAIVCTRISDANPQENSRRRHRDEERRPFVNPLGLREVSSDGLFRGAEVRGKV